MPTKSAGAPGASPRGSTPYGPLVVVTDDRFAGRYAEERDILAEVGARLQVMDLSSEEQAAPALREADGILVNLFPLGARLIRGLRRCLASRSGQC